MYQATQRGRFDVIYYTLFKAFSPHFNICCLTVNRQKWTLSLPTDVQHIKNNTELEKPFLQCSYLGHENFSVRQADFLANSPIWEGSQRTWSKTFLEFLFLVTFLDGWRCHLQLHCCGGKKSENLSFFWHLIVLVLYFLINLELRDVLAESLTL